ncbi:MAG: alpha/beta hydrolase [Myxococcales bacterium]|nr:alpha/beta hydrolase [Myxococcales bacterium]
MSEALSPLAVPDAYMRGVFRSSGLESHQIELPSASLHAWVGRNCERPPLLLLHGFGSDAQWQWFPQVRALSRHFRLFVPDLVYFGRSVCRYEDYHLDRQIDAMLELMDHFGVRRFDLAGISFGGLVAADLASRRGDRVRRSVLIDTPAHVMLRHEYDAMLARMQVDDIADLLCPAAPEGIRRLMGVAWHSPPPAPGFALRDAYRRMFTTQVEEKRRVMEALVSRIEADELRTRHISAPTLIVWGQHDRIFPVGIAKRLRRTLGDHARLHVIGDTAHAPNQERPAEFNRTVLRFLTY